MTGDAPDTKAFAENVAAALYPRDTTAHRLGIKVDAIDLGAATLSMTAKPELLNGHDVVHGGYLFLLADTAMAYASNSYNRNALAQHAQVTFVSPGQAGETLTATAREVSLSGRNGLFDVDVRGGDGRLIAAFRGSTRVVNGMVDDALGEAPKR